MTSEAKETGWFAWLGWCLLAVFLWQDSADEKDVEPVVVEQEKTISSELRTINRAYSDCPLGSLRLRTEANRGFDLVGAVFSSRDLAEFPSLTSLHDLSWYSFVYMFTPVSAGDHSRPASLCGLGLREASQVVVFAVDSYWKGRMRLYLDGQVMDVSPRLDKVLIEPITGQKIHYAIVDLDSTNVTDWQRDT